MENDLTRALEAIATTAGKAQRSLDTGRAVNGRTALARIQELAEDALRHRDEDLEHAGTEGRFEHA